MRQFILADEQLNRDEIELRDDDFRYLSKVLRLNAGDDFPAVDKTGRRYRLTIKAVEEDCLKISCSESDDPPASNTDEKTEIILVQCLPKGKKLEQIVRQSVEAGVDMIIPVESENSVAVIREERNEKKQRRLEKIAEEAAQQSGNPGVPDITSAVKIKDLPEILNQRGFDGIKLFFHQDRLDKASLHGYLNSCPSGLVILIGPEGGISPAETDFLLASGFHPVYLGENVLRTETAAIFALGAVKTILLEKDKWITEFRE